MSGKSQVREGKRLIIITDGKRLDAGCATEYRAQPNGKGVFRTHQVTLTYADMLGSQSEKSRGPDSALDEFQLSEKTP